MRYFEFFRRSKRLIAANQRAWLNEKFDLTWMDNYGDWVSRGQGRNAHQYMTLWAERCKETPTATTISPHDDLFDAFAAKLDTLDRFGAHLEARKPIALDNKLIDALLISGSGPLRLTNCAIRKLDLRNGPRDVTLIDCRVKELHLSERCLGTLEMIGGSIQRMFAPTPGEKSPFTGSAEIRRVHFSATFANAQAYRNLRHHLTTLHNHEAASAFHAAEMKAEVSRQSFVDRLVSRIYQALSNYGGSSVRPLVIFIAVLGINCLFLEITDGAVSIGNAEDSEGWHTYLFGEDQNAIWLRAIVFSLTQTFNPLGIFGTRLLLAGRTPTIAFISSLLGILSTLALALFVLAIRRRFRLDRSG